MGYFRNELGMTRQRGGGAGKSRAFIVSSEVAKAPVRAAGYLLKTGPFGSPRGDRFVGSATFGGIISAIFCDAAP